MRHQRQLFTAFACLLACALPASASGPFVRYALDPGSSVQAKVSFFGISSKSAAFPRLAGRVELDPTRLQAINLDVTLDAKALTSADKSTMERLRGKDFFDVETYPTVHYRGTAMRMTGDRTGEVSGQITARGITRPSTLSVTFATPPSRMTGREAVVLTGTTQIDRRQFGMTAYQMIVGTKVSIVLKARMVPG